jgi:hypothetical protein
MIVNLRAASYWTKLIDYYYDHIHWDLNGAPTGVSLREWLRQAYGCRYVHSSHTLEFADEKAAIWFRLTWS